MSERNSHLDLLADHVVNRMQALLRDVLRENVSRDDAIEAIRLNPEPLSGDKPWNIDQLHYADALLIDVIGHLQERWRSFRHAESLVTAAIIINDEGDFEG